MKLINLKLLVTEDVHKGKGTPEDPHRSLLRAETLRGDLVFQFDPHTMEFHGNDLMARIIREAKPITE